MTGRCPFQAADARVHDTAVRLAERAEQADGPGVVQALADLQQACVDCHDAFRPALATTAAPDAGGP